MQLPTNYKMGTGLAAAFMGGQAGLEQEKMGLENVVKGMQLPAEQLKMQEAQMLSQNPEYLQQKVANTMIDLRNQYSSSDFQETLNAANRIGIELQAAGGDPAKQQQVVQKALTALKIDPSSEFAQYAMKDPMGALTKFKEGVETAMIGSAGSKPMAEMARSKFEFGEKAKISQAEIAGRERVANINAASSKYAADRGADMRDTNALIQAENNLRSRISQYDATIEKYARGDLDSDIIASLRTTKGGKQPEQSEIQAARKQIVEQLKKERNDLSKRADQYGNAVTGRFNVGNQNSPDAKTSELPPGVSVVTPK